VIAAAQVKPRVVVLGKQYDNQPLKLLGCQIGPLSFADCARIEADNDWWQNIKFIVKNVSGRTISWSHQYFEIEKQGNMQYARMVNLLPDVDYVELMGGDGKPTGKFGRWIRPGEVVMFRPPTGETKETNVRLELHDVTDLEKIKLYSPSVFFVDGTEWNYGREVKIPAGQTDDLTRKLIKGWTFKPSDPISIEGVEAHGRKVELETPFATSDAEWLKDLKITFSNRTERGIRTITFYFTLYEGHPMKPPLGELIKYGDRPPDTAARPPAIEPGQSATIGFGTSYYEAVRKYLPAWKELDQQTTADLSLGEIVFTDGVKWERGCYHQPNPERRNQWLSDCMK